MSKFIDYLEKEGVKIDADKIDLPDDLKLHIKPWFSAAMEDILEKKCRFYNEMIQGGLKVDFSKAIIFPEKKTPPMKIEKQIRDFLEDLQ